MIKLEPTLHKPQARELFKDFVKRMREGKCEYFSLTDFTNEFNSFFSPVDVSEDMVLHFLRGEIGGTGVVERSRWSNPEFYFSLKAQPFPFEYYLGLKYPVTIVEAEEGGYFAEIRELPGCFSQAETLNKVWAMIQDARKAWLEVAWKSGDHINLFKEVWLAYVPATNPRQSSKISILISK